MIVIDTNVLVYAHSATEPNKNKLAVEALDRLSDSGEGAVTTQVLAEFYVAMSRLLKPFMDEKESRATARRMLEDYASDFPVLTIEAKDVVEAASAVDRRGMSFWDALVWATAKSHGVEAILSEDGPTGAEIEGVKYVSPFME